MPAFRPRSDRSALIVIDVQPNFLRPIHDRDSVLGRIRFISRFAELLGVPILATEQVPAKMGTTHEDLAPLCPTPVGKETFGAVEAPGFVERLRATGRTEAILVGIETHICVSQTALGLLDVGYRVAVCPDAVGARTLDRHKLGMERMRDEGILPIHSEAVAYEWLGSAAHPTFREALALVKAADEPA